MKTTTIFLQVQGQPGLKEINLETPNLGSLAKGLAEAKVASDAVDLIFLDEADDPIEGDLAAVGVRAGTRVHITKCRKIKATVNYLDQTAARAFGPGVRVRKVKAWAVKHFKLEDHDAAEHVLQLCGTTERPKTDTPLHELTDGKTCAVCFDLVPETRVEG